MQLELGDAEAKEVLASAGELDVEAVSAFDAASFDLVANPMLPRWQSLPGKRKRAICNSNRVSDEDRCTLLSFMSRGDHHGYAPQNCETIGFLKLLKDEMSADLTNAAKRSRNVMGLKAAPKTELSLEDCAGRRYAESHQLRRAPLVEYISPTLAVIAAPAPVAVCSAPILAVIVARAPVVKFIAPAPAVTATVTPKMEVLDSSGECSARAAAERIALAPAGTAAPAPNGGALRTGYCSKRSPAPTVIAALALRRSTSHQVIQRLQHPRHWRGCMRGTCTSSLPRSP